MPHSSSEQEIIRIVKRRQAVTENLGRLVGIVSLVAIIAFSARAIYKRVSGKSRANQIAMEQVLPAPVPVTGAAPYTKASVTDPQIVDLSQRGPLTPSPSHRVSMVDLTKPAETRSFLGNPVAADKSGTSSIPASKQQQIAVSVKAFFAARSVSDFLPIVRDVSRVKPLMEGFYRWNSFRISRWKGVGWTVPIDEKGFRLVYVQALFEDAPPVNVVVEETSGGDYRVDWESAVHYCDMGWEDFQSKKPTDPKLFRLMASKADASEVGSSGAEKLTFLRLKHPKENGVIYGSFDKSDPNLTRLVQQLELCQWKDAPVIVRLGYPAQGQGGAVVQITGAEGKGWLVLETVPRG